MSKTESKITKTQQIEDLNLEIENLLREIDELHYVIDKRDSTIKHLEGELAGAERAIRAIRTENELLSSTPEIAADTKAAFDRGRNDGVRSLTTKATKDLLGFANELNALMNELANKYTRDLTLDVFLGTVEPVEEVKKLPVTDFTEKLLHNAHKCF